MKMPEFRNTFEQKNLARVVGNEIHRAEWKLGKSAGRKAGVGGLAPGKFSMTTTFRLLENAQFLENLP